MPETLASESTATPPMTAEHGRLKIAQRAVDLPVFQALATYRDAIALANAGTKVYHLEVGQPGMRAPEPVRTAAKQFIDHDKIAYTPALGTSALRQAISNWYHQHYNLSVPGDRIVVTMGASGAFVLAELASFAPGAVIASAIPGYPCYRLVAQALGFNSLGIVTRPEDDFKLTPSILEANWPKHGRIDGLIIGSPNNPTGSIMSSSELEAIAAYCKDRRIRLIVDEVYHGLEYNQPATSLATDGSAIVINSFSKYFCMPGWRIGWMVAPDDMIATIEKVAQNVFISASSLAQHAAVQAFTCLPELNGYRESYRRNRNKIIAALPAMGFSDFTSSDGGLYVYARLASSKLTAAQFSRDLLAMTGVAITPGNDFDPYSGSKWVRISFCATENDVDAAIALMSNFYRRNAE